MESIPHASGIYQILCVPTGKIYIGSARDLLSRWWKHRSDLELGKHQNRHLQRAWEKYGPDAFVHSVIELVFEPCLIEREQYWLDRLRPFQDRGFNICVIAGSSLGVKRSDEYKARLAESARARMQKPESKAAVSAVHKGKVISESQKEAIREFGRRRVHTVEEHLKVADAHAMDFVVTDPEGNEHHIRNLAKFAREQRLGRRSLLSVAQGKSRHHKGWKCRYK